MIDPTAAGFGWFIDGTPQDDSEFRSRRTTNEWRASPRTGASGHIDLLTVVMHELGHVLGLEHSDSGHSHELMSGTLTAGIRRLPTVDLDHKDATLKAHDAVLAEWEPGDVMTRWANVDDDAERQIGMHLVRSRRSRVHENNAGHPIR